MRCGRETVMWGRGCQKSGNASLAHTCFFYSLHSASHPFPPGQDCRGHWADRPAPSPSAMPVDQRKIGRKGHSEEEPSEPSFHAVMKFARRTDRDHATKESGR